MFSRVVEGADPYRGIEKTFISPPPRGCANITREEQAPPLPRSREIRSVVRRRKVVRTRMRTPHPSAFGCHLPPLGKAFGKCEHRLKPKDRANNVTAGCKHTPLRSVASLLRKHCPRPTNVTLYSVHTRDNLFPINSPIHIPVEVCFFVSRPNHKPDRTPVEIYFPPANLSNP